MQQFSKSFLKLLEVFRAEDDDSPADFLIFSRKAQLLLDILQENAIKTLSSEEFRGKAFAGSALEKNPKKFFIPFGETLRFGLSPMQAVRYFSFFLRKPLKSRENPMKSHKFRVFSSGTSSRKMSSSSSPRSPARFPKENSTKPRILARKQRKSRKTPRNCLKMPGNSAKKR